MSKYKCVIFDCDGVLVDSEIISIGVLTELANSYGANLDLNHAVKLFKGCSMNQCIELINSHINTRLPEDFEFRYRAESEMRFKQEIKPIPGVIEVLQQLHLPFCVASSGPEHKMRLNLTLTGLIDKFEGKLFSCYAIKKWKPEPDVFLWAAKTMGFYPHECLIIEDSYSGVTAAKAGGFDVFGYTAHDYHDQLKGYSTLEFNDMKDLIPLIRQSK